VVTIIALVGAGGNKVSEKVAAVCNGCGRRSGDYSDINGSFCGLGMDDALTDEMHALIRYHGEKLPVTGRDKTLFLQGGRR